MTVLWFTVFLLLNLASFVINQHYGQFQLHVCSQSQYIYCLSSNEHSVMVCTSLRCETEELSILSVLKTESKIRKKDDYIVSK